MIHPSVAQAPALSVSAGTAGAVPYGFTEEMA